MQPSASQQPSTNGGNNKKLASNKYFNPQELNDLARVGKQPLPGVKHKQSNARTGSANVAKNSNGASKPAVAGKQVRRAGDLKKLDAPKTI